VAKKQEVAGLPDPDKQQNALCHVDYSKFNKFEQFKIYMPLQSVEVLEQFCVSRHALHCIIF